MQDIGGATAKVLKMLSPKVSLTSTPGFSSCRRNLNDQAVDYALGGFRPRLHHWGDRHSVAVTEIMKIKVVVRRFLITVCKDSVLSMRYRALRSPRTAKASTLFAGVMAALSLGSI